MKDTNSPSATEHPVDEFDFERAVAAIRHAAEVLGRPDARKVVDAIHDAAKAVAAIQDAVKAVAVQDAVKAVAVQDAVKAVAAITEQARSSLREVVSEEIARALALVRESAEAAKKGNP